MVSGVLVEVFKLEMMVPQRNRESSKTLEGIMVSLPVTVTEEILETQKNGWNIWHGVTEGDINPPMTNTRPALRFRHTTIHNYGGN